MINALDNAVDIPVSKELEIVSTTSPAGSDQQSTVALFRYSGLVDQLRDNAMELAKLGIVSKSTLRHMAYQYMELRSIVAESLRTKCDYETLHWAPSVDEVPPIDTLYYACSQLSRWADVVHQTPNFLIAQELQLAAAEKMRVEALPQPVKQVGFAAGAYL